MRRMAVIWIIMILCAFPSAVFATHHDEWQRLDKISDQALQLAKNKRFEEAKDVLNYFSDEFLKLNARDRLKSMDELRAITITHENALKAITASTLPAEDRIDQVVQFRLVIDAVHSNYQPLWAEMESSIMGAFQEIQTAIESGDEQQFQTGLQQFLHQYEIIEPSVKIDVEPAWAKKADQDIEQLQSPSFHTLDKAKQQEQLAQMRQDLAALFNHMKKDEADSSLLWVMISTGGMIILTLTYVGFRKYRGEKQKARSHEEQ
jgi:sporulation protein YpjB